MTSKLIVEGLGGTNSFALINVFFALIYAAVGGGAYCAAAFLFGWLTLAQSSYIFAFWLVIGTSLTMFNFVKLKSVVYMAFLEVFSSLFGFPVLLLSCSIAYYLGYSVTAILLLSICSIAFVFWSQSEEVRHASLVAYFDQGLSSNYFRQADERTLVYDMRQRKFAPEFLKSVDYPHKKLAKFTRGLAIVIGIIVIPFGQKEVYADPSRDYQNMPTIFMLLSFLFFIVMPHVFSSAAMLVKLNRSLRQGEIILGGFKTSEIGKD